MRRHALIWVSLLLCAVSSCGPKVVYQQVTPLPGSGWDKEHHCSYQVDMNAENKDHDILLEIRHSGNYKYANLFLFLRSEFPDGNFRTDTIECLLAEPDGRWYGSGLGDLYSLTIPFRKNVQFRQEGTYIFQLQHGMREDNLVGITDIGITLTKTENE